MKSHISLKSHSSIITRTAVGTTIVTFLTTLLLSIIFINVQQKLLVDQAFADLKSNLLNFSVPSIENLYIQKKYIQLFEQKTKVNQHPNVLYSYIVNDDGKIDVGLSGLNSPDVGKSQQIWEPEYSPLTQHSPDYSTIKVTPELKNHFPNKNLDSYSTLTLMRLNFKCPSDLSSWCSELRVAVIPETVQGSFWKLALNSAKFSLVFIVIIVCSVVAIIYAQFKEIRRMSDKMMANNSTGDVSTEKLQKYTALRKNDAREIAILKEALRRFIALQDRSARDAISAQLVSTIAHEVHGPFQFILRALDQLQENINKPDFAATLLATLNRTRHFGKKIDAVLLDVLECNRDRDLSPTTVSLFELCKEGELRLQMLMEDKIPKLDIYVQDNIFVSIERERVLRVFENILVNAVQAINGNTNKNIVPSIWMKAALKPENGMIHFEIGNTGSFIPPEHMPRIFDFRFSRGKSSGTGLGLFVVKKCILDHGGTIECESSLESGVQFTMTLPVAVSIVPADNTAIVADSRFIIIVDDNPIFRSFWERSSLGNRCITYSHPLDLENAISTGEIKPEDCVCFVIDLDFGPESKISGDELARNIKIKYSIPVFLFTSLPMQSVSGDIRACFDGVLQKNSSALTELRRHLGWQN